MGVIQRSDQKLQPFLAVILVWHEHNSSLPSSDSIATPRKTASENSCKNLSAIQLSDQKLRLFLAIILLWREQTFSSPSSDSIATSKKAASRNS
jgi:hypothetical protein